MPTYSYQCKECKHQFDSFQKITDAPLELCPSCGQSSLERGIGGGMATFRFQGEGFYETDYKKQPSCCPCGKNQCDS